MGTMFGGLGGWILTTITPLVFSGGKRAVFRKSLSPDISVLFVLMARVKADPFLTPLGTHLTSWPFSWRNFAIPLWRSSSTRNFSRRESGNANMLFFFDDLYGVMQSGLNRFLFKGWETFQNLLSRHPAFHQFQNRGNGYTRALKDGPTMAKGRVYAYVPINNSSHELKYNTTSRNGQFYEEVTLTAARLARAEVRTGQGQTFRARLTKILVWSAAAGVGVFSIYFAGGLDWYLAVKGAVPPMTLFYAPAALLDAASGVFVWSISDAVGQVQIFRTVVVLTGGAL